jgi:hypothetical protein
MPYVYLKFPFLEDFRDFLIAQNIHEYAAVQRKVGANLVTYYYRLTAKVSDRQEIAVCDITVYEGLEIEPNPKKDEQWKQVWQNIEKTMSEVFVELPGAEDKEHKVPWMFTVIDAEYSTKE